MAINPISSLNIDSLLSSEAQLSNGKGTQSKGDKSFGEFLTDALNGVNTLQQDAGDTVKRFSAGDRMDVHKVMIALEQATTALSLTVQVRNKLVDAYQEIMKTQV